MYTPIVALPIGTDPSQIMSVPAGSVESERRAPWILAWHTEPHFDGVQSLILSSLNAAGARSCGSRISTQAAGPGGGRDIAVAVGETDGVGVGWGGVGA